MTKPRLTLNDHTKLGQSLASMRDELVKHQTQVCSAYPQTGPESGSSKKITAALKALDAARVALEESLFNDYPAYATPAIYYPNRDR